MPESPSLSSGPATANVVASFNLLDFSEAAGFFPSWRGRFEQISRGCFRGKLRVVHGQLVRIAEVMANQKVRVIGHDVSGTFSVYPVLHANAGSVWQGRQFTPGQLIVHGPETEKDHCTARRSMNMGMSIRLEALEDAARVLLGSDIVALPQFWAAHSPPPDPFASFTRQLSRLLTFGVSDASLPGTPDGHRLEQECVRSLVAVLCSTTTPQPDLSLPARSRLLRKAEEFMRSHLGQAIGAIDLCRDLGVSDRTLRLAFRERYGLGPIAFFKCLRLNAVRSKLRATSHLAIADAAHEFGFHHLGNFASDYRELFGERPSETERHGAG